MKISYYRPLLLAAFAFVARVSGAQQVPIHPYLDSTVVEYADGSVRVNYTSRPLGFGPIAHPNESERRHLSFTEEEKAAHAELRHSRNESSVASLRKDPRLLKSVSGDYEYAVGEIPLKEGVSPSGARTYQIPISAASGYQLCPSVSIGYNSQGGDGWLGYGWDIQGLSSITLISRNSYYHGESKGANIYEKDAVFALDGIPLVKNTQPGTSSEYPLITASGNIIAKPIKNSNGYVSQFRIRYPNGTTALFGLGFEYPCNQISYPIKEMEDKDGNKVTYGYTNPGGAFVYRLRDIRYGYNSSDSYIGEVSFEYETNLEYTCRYFAGSSTSRASRLTRVVSKYGRP